ncbi:uncharacterized protein LOC131663023 [Phymastichus coffea]|uniref:uncharacterized protein LOC131663023 n=1 Tax=Phymastichus coffea TaxID=108790 RepID=UPI00273AFBE2|nr:uncharacterized protein LOC131663023 [Phymastichus coffea]
MCDAEWLSNKYIASLFMRHCLLLFFVHRISNLNPEDRSVTPLYAVALMYYLATLGLLQDYISKYHVIFQGNCSDFELGVLGFVAVPFCSLFNHSYCLNTVLIKLENNEIIAYVDRPIPRRTVICCVHEHQLSFCAQGSSSKIINSFSCNYEFKSTWAIEYRH